MLTEVVALVARRILVPSSLYPPGLLEDFNTPSVPLPCRSNVAVLPEVERPPDSKPRTFLRDRGADDDLSVLSGSTSHLGERRMALSLELARLDDESERQGPENEDDFLIDFAA
jgi:hypothetical protein